MRMLRQLISLWRHQGFMKKVVEEFGQMLQDDRYVFSHAWEAFQGQLAIDEIKQSIHEKDKHVNEREREIRRMLLEHLSVNPGQDISGCLVMMSLVKDAERIGDYSKNIFDLGVVLKGHAKGMKYCERLSAIQGKLDGHLTKLERAFLDGNEQLAKDILSDYTPIKNDCSNLLNELFSGELPTREAVATALLSRFLKRINSHISNIASGLVYPLDQIDFVRGGILD